MCRQIFLPLLAFLLLAVGCESKPKYTDVQLELMPPPQKQGLPEPSGGFVLAVAGEVITSKEIVTTVMERFRPVAQRNDFEQFKTLTRPALEQLLTSKISSILLYDEAKNDVAEEIEAQLKKAVNNEVARFLAGFGGDYARAEDALKQMGMDWQSFREYQEKMILSQSYIQSQLPEDKPITYSELTDYYDRMKGELFFKPAMIRFRLIDIEVAKVEAAEPNESRQEKAKALAGEVVGRIQQGADFGKLAKRYSHGHRRQLGGLWKPVHPESLAEPYDVLAAEADRIRPGQTAGPIEADGHIFIMKLEEKQPEGFKPFDEVQKEIEARIDFERRKTAIDELSAKLVQQAALGEKDAFIDFCLKKIYQASKM